MDAPPIQYARTDDGVNIAYWTLGEGPPVLILHSLAFSHLVLEWDVPAMRRWYERMAEQHTVVRLNLRGGGLSDRDVAVLGLDEFARDMDAVIGATGFDRVALIGSTVAGAIAIHYATTRPDRITRLALFDASPDHASDRAELFWKASAAVRDLEPSAFAVLLVGQGNSEDNPGQALEALMQGDFDSDRHPEIVNLYRTMNVTQQLADIQCPTLVLGHRAGGFGDPQALAAGIPGARLAFDDGASVLPYFQDADTAFEIIHEFLREGSVEPTKEEHVVSGAFRTILFTDLESSTALTQAVGDAKAQDVLHGHNDAVRAALAAHDGEEVKHTGDGIMASFGSAVSAVEAALAIQRDLAGGEVRVRVGLNAGEPIQEEGDLFGGSVQLAARVCDRAEPGQVLVSNVVRELCTGKLFQFADQGEATLKGFPEPVRLFTVTPPEGDA
jgi:class 3 adenylate cyclase